MAPTLERATTLDDPDAIVDAMKKTNYSGGLMQYGGPVVFNEVGRLFSFFYNLALLRRYD